MNPKVQEWYEAIAENYTQNPEVEDEAFQLANQNMEHPLALNLHSTYPMSEMPSSIRLATEKFRIGVPDQRVAHNGEAFENLSPGDEPVLIAATTPSSFYQRSLRQVMPYIHDNEALFEELYTKLYLSQRADSVMESFDGLFNFGDHLDLADAQPGLSGMMQADDCNCHPSSLQYHLITDKSAVRCREGIANIYNQYNFPSSLTHTPSESPGKKSALSCPLCPDKQYTGDWANRNLNRHMERVHDGVKHFTCSHEDCPKTYKREDARLVHERKSHPDLNRPPPTKRKRSGEYDFQQ